MSKHPLRRAGATMIIFAVAGKAIGMVREMVTAATFGTSHTVDLYLAAIAIPAIIGAIAYQALPDAFVPIYASSDRHSQRQAWTVLVIGVVLSLGLLVFAAPLASLTSTGFSDASRREATALFRLGSFAVIFAVIEALVRSRLLVAHRFVSVGLSQLWPSIAMIVALVAYPQGGVHTLTWGYITGAMASAAWNLIMSLSGQHTIKEQSPPAITVMSQSGVAWVGGVVLVSVAGLLFGLIDRHYASFLPEGSIAALQFASLLAAPMLTVCGMALSTAAFPFLARAVHGTGDAAEAERIVNSAMRWSIIGGIGAAVITIGLGDELVAVVFERGAFDVDARHMTGQLMPFYGVWLIPAILSSIIGKVFFAIQRWKPLFGAVIAGVILKVVLSGFWVDSWQAMGLVAATVVATTCIAFVLLVAAPRWSKYGNVEEWIRLAGVMTILLGGTVLLSRWVFSTASGLSWHAVAVCRLALALGLGGFFILWLGPKFGVAELVILRQWIGIGRAKPNRS